MGNAQSCCQDYTILNERNSELDVGTMRYKDSAHSAKFSDPTMVKRLPYMEVEDLKSSVTDYSFLRVDDDLQSDRNIAYLDKELEDISAIESENA